jgi:alpha-tubulin suppressor-like RCC1 family protein
MRWSDLQSWSTTARPFYTTSFMNPKMSAAVVSAAFLLLTNGCSKDSAAPESTALSIAFTGDPVTIVADDSIATTLTMTMADSSKRPAIGVTYRSSDTSVATVSPRGNVTGIAEGVALITASRDSLRAYLHVTVVWAPVANVSITIGDSGRVVLDDTVSVVIDATNSHGRPAPYATISLSFSDTTTASVYAPDVLMGRRLGTVTVTATSGAAAAHADLNVFPQFTTLALGERHTCGLDGLGRMRCWGSDIRGQLGDDLGAPLCPGFSDLSRCSSYPVRVLSQVRFTKIVAGGFHTCGLVASGDAYCWGDDALGEAGVGSGGDPASDAFAVPTRISGTLRFASLTAGRASTCGVEANGTAHCWGQDGLGQLGAGTTEAECAGYTFPSSRCSRIPVTVTGGVTFTKVSAAEKATCGLASSGEAYCWGVAWVIQAGTDSTSCSEVCTNVPLHVGGGHTFQNVQVGNAEVCGLQLNGTIACWGFDSGRFGLGSSGPLGSDTAIVAASGLTVDELAVGRLHVCGLRNGIARCWGNNYFGQIGGTIRVDQSTPTHVVGPVPFRHLFAGSEADATCAIGEDTRAYCWGHYLSGQGEGVSSSVPAPVRLFP